MRCISIIKIEKKDKKRQKNNDALIYILSAVFFIDSMLNTFDSHKNYDFAVVKLILPILRLSALHQMQLDILYITLGRIKRIVSNLRCEYTSPQRNASSLAGYFCEILKRHVFMSMDLVVFYLVCVPIESTVNVEIGV